MLPFLFNVSSSPHGSGFVRYIDPTSLISFSFIYPMQKKTKKNDNLVLCYLFMCVSIANRFPEELSGVGCFGTTILRVLIGSGYTPVWSSVLGFYYPHNRKTLATLSK